MRLLPMRHDPKTYDDSEQLTVYLWRNYRYLLTSLESLADRALLAEAKAAHSSPEMAKRLQERWGAQNNPDVIAALADGGDTFRERVRDRMMKECRDSITLNRCPICARLVETPKARQCLWCGHDWHPATETR